MTVKVPGRVNLIGEHIDYHNRPVLPIAVQRGIRVSFEKRPDRTIAVSSTSFGTREFEWIPQLEPSPAGDWANYVKAAAQAVAGKWGLLRGIDASIASDLPPAAGLSSSSALLTALTLALLEANGIDASFEDLMDVLPEGEYFVGTRGGGMDHAAVLASRAGHATLIHFAPVRVDHIPIPEDWCFLIAHSMTTAEKSGAVREHYNSRRTAGARALQNPEGILTPDERDAYRHVTGETSRVEAAVEALHAADADTFGRLLNESHASLRDLLQVSSPALDEVTRHAREAGALGARLTGAGFGGCAILFTLKPQIPQLRQAMIDRYYSRQPGFDPGQHLITAVPSQGALGW